MSAWLRTGSERSARQQQAFARPLPPDRVPDPVLLTVLSCPFYGVTPMMIGTCVAAASFALALVFGPETKGKVMVPDLIVA
jgi:hypothetical protein